MPTTLAKKPFRIAVIDEERFGLVNRLAELLGDACTVLDATPLNSRRNVVSSADILVTEDWMPEPDDAKNLKLVQLLAAGFEHINPEVISRLECPIAHGSGASAVTVAEWCLGMMLYFAHRHEEILKHQREGTWHKDRVLEMTAGGLRGKVVGILGYGAVGREVARLCVSFGMQVHASLGRSERLQTPTYVTPGTGDPEGRLPSQWFTTDQLPSVVTCLDYLVLGLRVTNETRRIIDSKLLAHCKKGMVIINPARGALIDDNALIEALRTDKLGGAALDAYDTEPLPSDSPLRFAPHIVLSPHCAPESLFFRQELINCVASNIRQLLNHREPFNQIRRDRYSPSGKSAVEKARAS